MKRVRPLFGMTVALGACLSIAGCPSVTNPVEFIEGGTGNNPRLGLSPEITVLSPTSDVALTGGTPIEVNWQAVATTNFAVIDIFFDPDNTPNNGNEIAAATGNPLTVSTVTVDTSDLDADTYFVLAELREENEVVATDYAPGRLIVNQAPRLFFSEPRDNYRFDRTALVTPRFDVAWTVSDPDSTISIDFFLDPDDTPNGNEIFLRTSDDQGGDSFEFAFPTGSFDPGTYRILALVSDGVDTFAFYSPGAITLRERLAGVIDLRDLDDPNAEIRGAIFEGFNPRDNLGSFVSTTRDLDNDGFSDFLLMSQFGKPRFALNLQRTGVGEAYMIYGRQDRFSGRVNVNSTGLLFRGEVFEGVPEVNDPIRPSRGITSFTTLTDWDGDGFREFAFGLPFTDSIAIEVSNESLDADGYFRSGSVIICSSTVIRRGGGFNGGQLISLAEIGTRSTECCTQPECPHTFDNPKSPPARYFGGSATLFYRYGPPEGIGPGSPVNFGELRFGARFSSVGFGDQFGESISEWHFDSIIMNAPNRNPVDNIFAAPGDIPGGGVTSIFFCTTTLDIYPWGGVSDGDAALDLAENPQVNLLPHGGAFHYIVDDIAFSPGYVVDADNGEPCALNFSGFMPVTGSTTRLWGSFEGARVGNAIAVDDVNSDGFRDILVGSPFSNDGAGATFIIFGRHPDLQQGSELRLEELGLPLDGPDPDGNRVFDGLRIVGAENDRLGQSQDNVGDFNRDGVGDVVIGSPLLNDRRGGAAVFTGSREVINLTQEELPLAELPERGLGVIFEGVREGDLAGARVRGVGDIDGDGNDDILIAAPGASVRLDIDLDGTFEIDRTECGVVYLIYGSPDLIGRRVSLGDIGTEALPGAMFVGRESGHQLGAAVGELGDRANGIAAAGDVDGDGRIDLLLGSSVASPRDRTRAGEVYLIYGVGQEQ